MFSRGRLRIFLALTTLLSFCVSSPAGLVLAQDFASTNFILRDPITTESGGRSTSASFEFYSSDAQTVTGETTASNFIYHAGFLYFPTITLPIVTGSAGNGSAALSWSASVGTLGLSAATYDVGVSGSSGGPFSYGNVGNVLSHTVTGLSNGVPYYFVVRAIDAFNHPIATSTVISVTPTPPVTPPSGGGGAVGGGGGGGGGGGAETPITAVNFSGRAYPNSTVTLLKDAQVAATTIAGPDARFQINLTGVSPGTFIFSVYGEDKLGERSSLVTFPVSVTSGATTNVSGIFLTPTIAVDKLEVKKGETIAIFGQSAPVSEITIQVNSEHEHFTKVQSDGDGAYLLNFDTVPLELGQHTTKSRSSKDGEVSQFSKAVGFAVGTKTVLIPKGRCGKADMNCDGKVNLVDFSIAAFWYKRTLSSAFAVLEAERLNGDGKITIVDFSIMAYHWTG